MGKDPEAYVYLQNGINAFQNKSTYILLANLYRVTGKTNLAIQTFENFLVLNPGDQEIINTIEYLKQGLIY
jgi:Tfp pilus assembly protein PilF